MTDSTRRGFMKKVGAAAGLALSGCKLDAVQEFIHKRLRVMDKKELNHFVGELEEKYRRQFGREVTVDDEGPMEGVVFGYGLDLTRCNGNRRCVYACVAENNQSRPASKEYDSPIQWIRVLQMDKKAGIDLDHANLYYDPDEVPQEGHFYFPVQCQQCENPPCVAACPVEATWKEKDGIVVVDYDWCIGCRYCMAACPYSARHFNWATPNLPAEELNPHTHVLGNRPRPKGVVEKCTFCIQRTRKGLNPACMEACPTGARIFGNLLDPESEIRKMLASRKVFVFKEDLNTKPKFFYFT